MLLLLFCLKQNHSQESFQILTEKDSQWNSIKNIDVEGRKETNRSRRSRKFLIRVVQKETDTSDEERKTDVVFTFVIREFLPFQSKMNFSNLMERERKSNFHHVISTFE